MKSESGYPCMPPSFVNRSEELSRIQRAYSGSEAKAHGFSHVDEADNWEPFHARSHGWIFHAEMSNIHMIEITILAYVESGRHPDTQSEYPQPLAGL